jgi:hypothetical protein
LLIGTRGKLPSKPELPSAQCAKSWREVLPVHPAADLFPMMSESELRALGEDIKKNGLRVALAVFKEQKHFPPVLLDGRNRLAAMEAADIGIRAESAGSDADPQVKLWFRLTDKDMWLPIEIVEARGDHADGNPFEYVVSTNIHRRHLTGEQKRELIGKLLKVTPEKSNRQIAVTVKVSHVTVGAVRAEMESTGQIDQLVQTVGKDRKVRPSKRKRPPTRDQIHRQMAAKRAAVPKPLPTETVREAVAPDEELALLRELARFVIGRARVTTDPKDHIEWKVLLERVKQVLGGAPLRLKVDASAASAAAPPGDEPPPDEEWLLVHFKSRAKRELDWPLPQGMMIDSGDGPKPVSSKLGPLPEAWKETYRKVWRKLSPEDQASLADWVSESDLVEPGDGLDIPEFLLRRRVL